MNLLKAIDNLIDEGLITLVEIQTSNTNERLEDQSSKIKNNHQLIFSSLNPFSFPHK